MINGKGDDCNDCDGADDNTCDHTSNDTAGKGVCRAFCSLPSAILENLQTALVVVPDMVVEIDETYDWDKMPVAILVL